LSKKKLPNQIIAYVLKINQLQIGALKASNCGKQYCCTQIVQAMTLLNLLKQMGFNQCKGEVNKFNKWQNGSL
jgi:hypothetical protein